MHGRGTSTNVRTRTYDLIFSNKNQQQIKFHEFTEYKMARQVCHRLEKMLNIVVKDEYAEIRQRASKYRTSD